MANYVRRGNTIVMSSCCHASGEPVVTNSDILTWQQGIVYTRVSQVCLFLEQAITRRFQSSKDLYVIGSRDQRRDVTVMMRLAPVSFTVATSDARRTSLRFSDKLIIVLHTSRAD